MEALTTALEKLEKEAEDTINAKNEITDKAKAIEEAKAAIGKDALLKAIQDGVITATQAAKELENQSTTAEATKDQNPQADEIGATKQDGKALSELPATDKEKLDAAYNKEANKPIVKKLQDVADDLAEKIEKLTKVADKDKADATEKAKAVEEKNAALTKQNETLEKAKTALTTAKTNNSDKAIIDGLQDAVTRLEAAVASAKTAADEAQAKFDEVNEVVKAYKDEIDNLTDDYNATLGYINNLKEVPKGEESKGFNGGVNPGDAPTGDNGSDFSGGANDATPPTVADAPEFNGGVNPGDAPVANAPEYAGGVNGVEPAVNEVPEYTGGVNDDNAPTQPNNPDFNGGVNDDNATTQPNNPDFNGGVNDGDALTQPNNPNGTAPKPTKPEATNGQNAPVNYVPELGNVDKLKLEAEIAEIKEALKTADPAKSKELTAKLAEREEALRILVANLPAVNEVPAFDLAKLGTAQPSTPGVDFGQKAPKVKEQAKVEAKNVKSLPNTGMNTSSTTALGLSLIALVGVAIRRKLSK